MQKVEFSNFLELWNITQQYKTPLIHYHMAQWLQKSWESGETRLVLMAFRACGKSTMIGVFAAWLLWVHRDLRILVLAAEASLACKMVRNIRKIVENHPLTVDLIPTNPDQWASDRFTLNREKELRDPSVLAAGVTGNITGSRADIIIYDDVEVPNTCGTPDKRESLRERLSESNFILVPGGTQLYVGTPHNYFSIYAEEARAEIGEDEAFLAGFQRYKQPLLDVEGKSVWPEQFSNDDIALLKEQSGPNRFESQMMLRPRNILDSRLDTSLLNYYDDEWQYREANQEVQLLLQERKLVSCTAWWDPAFASAKGDSSVLAIIYTDEEGAYYLHRLFYITVSDKGGEAYEQCEIVAEKMKEFLVPSVAIELNGIGRFLPAILRQELGKKNIPAAVLGLVNSKPKNTRILEGFDAVMAAGELHVHDSVKQTPFLTEMMEWQPGKRNNRDDGLDAVAGALSCEPVRLKKFYSAGQKTNWSKAGRPHKASSEFDV